MKIRKGDTVFIRTGEDRGKKGKVLFINTSEMSVLVEGINMRKRSQRPSKRNPKGGIMTIEAPLHISNVALFNSAINGPTKVGFKILKDGDQNKKVRICKKTGEEI
ncbi:MAG TPA: 50S ribosomal protein L24 [candidate division Zixibacteria bacterium]|nr:50S ribosomal protein L24 [candidate division Zixibacteria bacterium]